MKPLAATPLTDVGRPRQGRRWSDGPRYEGTTSTDDAWSLERQWPAVSARVAADIADAAGLLRGEASALRANGGDPARVAAIEDLAGGLQSTSRTLQQLVRLGSGAVEPVAERVELARLARRAVHDRLAEFARRGIRVSLDTRPAEVFVDPAMALDLVDAALDWACAFGAHVEVKVDRRGAGGAARLLVRAAAGTLPEKGGERRVNDSLTWVLLRQLGVVAGVAVSRSSRAAAEAAVLEFEPNHFLEDGIVGVELLTRGATSPALPDAWVLAIVPDEAMRDAVVRTLAGQGLDATGAASCAQARALCEARHPQVVVGSGKSPSATDVRRLLGPRHGPCTLVRVAAAAMGDLDRLLVPVVLEALERQS